MHAASTPHTVYVGDRRGIVGANVRCPGYSIGDRLHLDRKSRHPRQIRPLVSADMIPGVEYDPSMCMLVLRLPNGEGTLRPVIRLPPHQRQNTSQNSDAAWLLVLEHMPSARGLCGDDIPLAR